MNTVKFISDNNNQINQINIAKTLISFAEYDFSLFYDKATRLAEKAMQTQRIGKSDELDLKKMITLSHPYIASLIKREYSEIVIDVIIDKLCNDNKIDTNTLWQRKLSPVGSFDKRLFVRLSQYKTYKAANQWCNIINAQNYAKKKAGFVFGVKADSNKQLRDRVKYFDLAVSVALSESGFPKDQIFGVEKINVSSIPDSVFLLPDSSRIIYSAQKSKLNELLDFTDKKINKALSEKYIFKASEDIINLDTLPDEQMLKIIKEFDNNPEYIYRVHGLKAIIDLEIDEMILQNKIIRRCENCNKFFEFDSSYKGRFCNRVNSTGKTCREQFESGCEEGRANDILDFSEDVYLKIFEKAGKEISMEEFYEWSDYFSALRDKYRENIVSAKDVEEFLNNSKRLFKC